MLANICHDHPKSISDSILVSPVPANQYVGGGGGGGMANPLAPSSFAKNPSQGVVNSRH